MRSPTEFSSETKVGRKIDLVLPRGIEPCYRRRGQRPGPLDEGASLCEEVYYTQAHGGLKCGRGF